MGRAFSLLLPIFLTGTAGPRPEVKMQLSTAAFPHEGPIPKPFTGDGADLSPALAWRGAPAGTRAFALVMDDPDAPGGTWVHWVLYDLPAEASALTEGQAKAPTLQGGAKQGKNAWGRLGYNGPAPPPGKAHRYVFRLYALANPTGLPPGATRAELDRAMKGHVLAEAQWMGVYKR